MKRKLDFVTNSSSVSFCMWGLSLSAYEIPESVMKNVYSYYLKNNNDKDNLKYRDFKSNGNVIYYFETVCRKNGLDLYSPPYSDLYYIGRELLHIKDNETMKEFKKSVDGIFESIGFDVKNNGILENGWHDG